jgi:clan AA aspartic protease (TIGR02281 family)
MITNYEPRTHGKHEDLNVVELSSRQWSARKSKTMQCAGMDLWLKQGATSVWWLAIDYEAIIAALSGAIAGAVIVSHAQAPQAPQTSERQVVIPVGSSNECESDLRANDHEFRVLLDSGATGHLTFGRNHARDLGFDPERLSYSHTYTSANGPGRYATVRLREVRLSGLVMRNVPAEITDASQGEPLLGLEILHALNFHLTKGYCLLTVPDGETVARVATIAPSPDRWRSDEHKIVSAPPAGAKVSQFCSANRLARLRSDKAMNLCEDQCAAVSWCEALRSPPEMHGLY